ncbi:MAG: toll/interleukin-1 receptor domain-containing protein, partial [Cyanobacteria bacterium P01_H01_bin.15]
DKEDILPGEKWARAIRKAQESSDLVIACLSKSSTSLATWVNRELRAGLVWMAKEHPDGTFLIPVRLDECELPDIEIEDLMFRLPSLQAWDFWDARFYEFWGRAIERKRATLKQH